jgi:iron complex outermembrane receptor protein
MNDLYWSPGGNPGLRNETANSLELTYDMKQSLSSAVKLEFSASTYYNSINDMIQWQPGSYAYWTAANLKKVNTRGLEASASAKYSVKRTSASVDLNYIFTKASTTASDISNDGSIGKQLIYVPYNQGNIILKIRQSDFSAIWITDFTGIRYTTSDNSSFLPAYSISSLSGSYIFRRKSTVFNVNISSENIFNTSYQTIAYFPQPGRSYLIKLIVQITK